MFLRSVAVLVASCFLQVTNPVSTSTITMSQVDDVAKCRLNVALNDLIADTNLTYDINCQDTSVSNPYNVAQVVIDIDNSGVFNVGIGYNLAKNVYFTASMYIDNQIVNNGSVNLYCLDEDEQLVWLRNNSGTLLNFDTGDITTNLYFDFSFNVYTEGYDIGFADGYNQDATVSSIFTNILNVGILPINMFLEMFNFEILGVNLAELVSGLLSICIIVILLRLVLGGKSDNG